MFALAEAQRTQRKANNSIVSVKTHVTPAFSAFLSMNPGQVL
jgi:hypothetical protein